MDMFMKASRKKLRFAYKGQASAEDLWDLSVEVLDGIYRKLRSEQKDATQDSLLTPPTGNLDLTLRVDIVKYIVETKLKEKEAQKKRAATRLRKQRIATLLEEKKDQGLKDKSIEELTKLLEELGQEE